MAVARRAVLLFRAPGVRSFAAATRPLRQAADKATPAAGGVAAPGPDNFQIAPTIIPWKAYKNEFYEKRGYTVAPKDWKEWSDLPAPFKYLGVRVNPEHVTAHGPVWKFFSDWKTAIPASVLLTLPLWMFNWLPPVDERFELAMIVTAAGWVMIGAAGPMFRAWKRTRVATKVKALLAAESDLNTTIATATTAFAAGAAVPQYIRMVNSGERAARALEAAAATRKLRLAQRDALAEQLSYLVAVSSAGAAESEAAVVKAARSAVEATLTRDASVQQRTVDAAVRALKDGVAADVDDPLPGLWAAAVAKAQADIAARPAAQPLRSPQQIDLFKKRFGYSDEAVTAELAAKAGADPAALALLTGKVGGVAPTAGARYVLKAPISYLKDQPRA